MIKLYENLDKKLGEDSYGLALKYKNDNPVKFFDIEKDFKKIDLIECDEENKKKLVFFLIKYKEIYFVPLELPDLSIFGFILKSKNSKNFFNFKLNVNYPMIFGLNDFNDYKYDKPIFLVEGIKEAMFVKLFYKYCIAYLTSQPSKKLWEYLIRISNKIIFLPDNDDVGKSLKYMNKFKAYNKYYPSCAKKDWGEYWEINNKQKEKMFENELNMILKKEGII